MMSFACGCALAGVINPNFQHSRALGRFTFSGVHMMTPRRMRYNEPGISTSLPQLRPAEMPYQFPAWIRS
jgi:hypothetical protein